jgi:hypothetical protein
MFAELPHLLEQCASFRISRSMSTQVFSRGELLSLYDQSIREKEGRLVGLIKPLPFRCFKLAGVITETQECDYEELPKEDAAKQLLAFVLETNSLEKYIGFSRCVQYIQDLEAKRIFSFISDLFKVGLHDPLRKDGKCTPSHAH